MTTIRIELDGMEKLIANLTKVGVAAEKAALATVTKLVLETQREARRGIQRGPKSGRTYRRGNVTHRASAPGQYPASDTGALASSVNVVLPNPSSLTGMVGTNLVYGLYLEFGTSRMAARPWLFPSFNKAKRTTAAELVAEFNKRVGGIR